MIRMIIMSICVCAMVELSAQAQDFPGAKDHPMLTRYPHSVIKWHDIQTYMPYHIGIGDVTGYRKVDQWVETQGQVTRIYYELTGERTHGDVYANYKKALTDVDFELIADGFASQSSQAPSIGSRKWLLVQYNANAVPSSAGIKLLQGSATSGGSAFLAAKKKHAGGEVYVAIGITQQRADLVTFMIDVIEVADVETDLVSINADAMGDNIDEYGKVALYGLYFDHDQSSLMKKSKPALFEITKLLRSRPKLKVYVVGHTDATGAYAYNQKLSEDRAHTIVETLVQDFEIARNRLEPHGVGPLTPIFSNRSNKGKEKNRRVELVER